MVACKASQTYIHLSTMCQNLAKNEFIFEFYDEKYIRIVRLNNQCETKCSHTDYRNNFSECTF